MLRVVDEPEVEEPPVVSQEIVVRDSVESGTLPVNGYLTSIAGSSLVPLEYDVLYERTVRH